LAIFEALKNKHNTVPKDRLTTVPLSEAAASTSQQVFFQPEWLRLPKPGALCIHSGLSRTVLYQLCKANKIQSNVLRQRGASRGIRLISYDSLMAYLRSLPTDTTGGVSTTTQNPQAT